MLSDSSFRWAARWARSWERLALPLPSGAIFDQLLAAYRSDGRYYHTLQHLAECFGRLDEGAELAERMGEVEVGLWFHDAVYDTHRHDNESASADWAVRVLRDAGAAPGIAGRVEQLILATRHAAPPATPDQSLLVDVDLAILGAGPERYAEYEDQVRREYAWVPEAEFRSRRRAILQGFLARPFLYSTGFFRGRLESAARANLEGAIARLEAA